MTTETDRTPEQQTADLIRSRFDELAPHPDDDTPDHALALAKAMAVDAQRYWHHNMSRRPVYDLDWDYAAKVAWTDSIHVQSFAFATAHLLLALHRVSPDAANEASREIAYAWDDGEPVGEWLHRHLREFGIDAERVNELEDAWEAAFARKAADDAKRKHDTGCPVVAMLPSGEVPCVLPRGHKERHDFNPPRDDSGGPAGTAHLTCAEPHPADYRCFDCATDEELLAAIPPFPAPGAMVPKRVEDDR